MRAGAGGKIVVPRAPPTNPQFMTTVSQITATATVAMEKKIPRKRSVIAPTAKPIRPVTHIAARSCTSKGAEYNFISATALYAPAAKNAPAPKFT